MNMVAGGDADGHQDRWLIWRGFRNVLQVDRRRVASRFCLIDGASALFRLRGRMAFCLTWFERLWGPCNLIGVELIRRGLD